jgi:hypothetical protein
VQSLCLAGRLEPHYRSSGNGPQIAMIGLVLLLSPGLREELPSCDGLVVVYLFLFLLVIIFQSYNLVIFSYYINTKLRTFLYGLL